MAVFFVTMNQVLYPMVLAITVWITGNDDTIVYHLDPTWEWFSSNYTALILFVIMTAICSKKDIKIFMKIGSYGVIFVVLLMVFIIVTGVTAMMNTDFKIGSYEE